MIHPKSKDLLRTDGSGPSGANINAANTKFCVLFYIQLIITCNIFFLPFLWNYILKFNFSQKYIYTKV